jgi:hypothetical protein
MHDDLKVEFKKLHAERQELRETLQRLEEFGATVKAVEIALVKLALDGKTTI